MKSAIAKYPLFLFLLPLFFVLNGYTSNYNFVPLTDALYITGLYLLSSLLIAGLFWLLYKDFIKASLTAFLIMFYQFFFGSIHDALKSILPGNILIKYSFILPASFILFFLIIILIKKNKSGFSKTKQYLNILFLILIVTELFILTTKITKGLNNDFKMPAGLTLCNSCPKPDIYLILADEYAGQEELNELFNFDNKQFLNQLKQRNFHTIPKSISNYNYTPFSMASILDMSYLDLENNFRQINDLTYSYKIIKENKVLQFLKRNGYNFYNYSIFDFDGQLAQINKGFLPIKTKLITSQTFTSRIERDIRYNLITRWKSKKELKSRTYSNKKNNEDLYKLTKDVVTKSQLKPKFVYTHLEMPHYPYYFDRNGIEQPFEKLIEGYQINKPAYIEYLQYSNIKLMALIDHILNNSKEPPIIILMGDHGFRHFTEKVDNKYHFLNLTTIYFPDKNYTNINDSLSSVNLFRLILNKNFRQQLPYLNDSTIYLKD